LPRTATRLCRNQGPKASPLTWSSSLFSRPDADA
jgi:hypothetical protein